MKQKKLLPLHWVWMQEDLGLPDLQVSCVWVTMTVMLSSPPGREGRMTEVPFHSVQRCLAKGEAQPPKCCKRRVSPPGRCLRGRPANGCHRAGGGQVRAGAFQVFENERTSLIDWSKPFLVFPTSKVGYLKYRLLNFSVKLCSLHEPLFYSWFHSFKNYMYVNYASFISDTVREFCEDLKRKGRAKHNPSPCFLESVGKICN